METDIASFVRDANITIPKKDWGKILIIDRDGGEYRFKEPVEVKSFPGFYYIPNFCTYAINRGGVLINVKTSKIRVWSKWRPGSKKVNTKGGYYVAPMVNDEGVRKSLSRHRALGLVFIPFQGEGKDFVINHKDGVPGNDCLENLEWVTVGENNQHAYDNDLHPEGRLVRVVVRWLQTDEERRYPSIAKCAAELGKSEGYVFTRIRTPHVRFSDGLALKFDDGTPWPDFTEERRSFSTKSVAAKNVFTGKITIYENVAKAAMDLGLDYRSVLNHTTNSLVLPYFGYNFRLLDENTTFPVFTEYHLKVFKKYPDGLRVIAVFVKDKNNEVIEFYESMDDARAVYRRGINTIKGWCQSGRCVDGKFFSLLRLKDVVQAPLRSNP